MLLTIAHENDGHLSINCTVVHNSFFNMIIVVYYSIFVAQVFFTKLSSSSSSTRFSLYAAGLSETDLILKGLEFLDVFCQAIDILLIVWSYATYFQHNEMLQFWAEILPISWPNNN